MITTRNSIRVEMSQADRLEQIRQFYEFSSEDKRRHLLGILRFEPNAIIYTNPFILDYVPLRSFMAANEGVVDRNQVSIVLNSILQGLESCDRISHGCITLDNVFIHRDNVVIVLGPFGPHQVSSEYDLLCVAQIARELRDSRSAQVISEFARSHPQGTIKLPLLLERLNSRQDQTPFPNQVDFTDLSDELTRFTTLPKPDPIRALTPPAPVQPHDPENLEKPLPSSKSDSLFSATLTYIWSRFSYSLFDPLYCNSIFFSLH